MQRNVPCVGCFFFLLLRLKKRQSNRNVRGISHEWAWCSREGKEREFRKRHLRVQLDRAGCWCSPRPTYSEERALPFAEGPRYRVIVRYKSPYLFGSSRTHTNAHTHAHTQKDIYTRTRIFATKMRVLLGYSRKKLS